MAKNPNENSTMIDEKPLKGEGDYVLRLIQIDEGKNNLRICLSVRGQVTSTKFGGQVAFEIKPDLVRHYFKIINTKDDFFHYSERLRKALVDLLKA